MGESKVPGLRGGMKKRVLMIVENSYPFDIRVKREADVVKQRYNLTIISIMRPGQKFREIVDGVEVLRLPRLESGDDRIKTGFFASLANKIGYVVQYSYFTTVAALIFLVTIPFRRYRVIHVHNPPDTLFLVGILGKLFRTRFVYDHHDLSPELYLTKYGGRKDFIYRIMLWCEKASCKLANAGICTNESYRNIEIMRHGIDKNKTYVVRNDPDVEEFRPSADRGEEIPGREITLLYLGSINPQDGVDVLLRGISHLRNQLKRENFTCRIIGSGDSLSAVEKYANDLGLIDKVKFLGLIRDRAILREHLQESDICLEPAPENELNRHSTFIKVLEYMSAGKPVVAFDLEETRYSVDGGAILVRPGNIEGFAEAISSLMDNVELRRALGAKGRRRVESDLNWERSSIVLNRAYDSLGV